MNQAQTAKQPPVAKWTDNIAALHAKLADARAHADAAKSQRDRVALDAHLGDAAARVELDAANAALRAAELDAESLFAAIEQAETQLEAAHDAARVVADAERARQCRRLAEEKLVACRQVEKSAAALAIAVERYRTHGVELQEASGKPSAQLVSGWRLEAYLDHTLGTAYVEPAMRKPLHELEATILKQFL